MEGKYCPVCGKTNDSELAVCSCGYSISNKASVGPKIPPYEPIQRPPRFNRVRLRILGLAVFLVLSAAVVLAFFNYSGASTEDNDSISETDPAPKLGNKANPAGYPAAQNVFEGVVTRVITGDAITVRDLSNTEYQVRLFDIVAPKLNAKFGKEAKESLSGAILGKTVRVLSLKIEESGVIYGRVIRDGTNIGLEQIQSGFAAHNNLIEQPETERKLYADAEALAKKSGLGLWSIPELTGLPSGPALASTNDVIPPSSGPNALAVSNGEQSYRFTSGPPEQKTEVTKKSEEIKPPSSLSVVITPKESPSVPITPKESPTSTVPLVPVSRSTLPVPPVGLNTETRSVPANTASARKYVRGPRGGCYYMNSKGSKSYVDHSLCQ